MTKLLLGVFVAGLITGGVWVYNHHDQATQLKNSTAAKALETLRQKAIDQAQGYAPSGICAQVMTPAKHDDTGAEYTFPTSCIPSGWTRIN